MINFGGLLLGAVEAFEVLAGAGMVAFGGVGFAGTTLPETAAFEEVVAAGPDVRPRLEALLRDATPAGRVYAATALERLDPDAGRAAWRTLADDGSEITTASGCLIDKQTVARYAGDRLLQNRDS